MVGEEGRVEGTAMRDEQHLLKMLAQHIARHNIHQGFCTASIKRTERLVKEKETRGRSHFFREGRKRERQT